jgi:hypothetical protein
MASPIRFWGMVLAVKPRLVLTKFEGETSAHSAGYIALLDGTLAESDGGRPLPGQFTVALGPATQERRAVSVGDLLRGDGYAVPDGHPDTPADLYRVGTLRTIARQGEPGGGTPRASDPPRTDPPLSHREAEQAPRRALHATHLDEEGPCRACSYGVIVPVVRLSDPRDYRNGRWAQVPACLGPVDCRHYLPPDKS